MNHLQERTLTQTQANLKKLRDLKHKLVWDYDVGTPWKGWQESAMPMIKQLAEIAQWYGEDFDKVKDDDDSVKAFLDTFKSPTWRVQ